MRTDLTLYKDTHERQIIAASLIVFGADVFKKAKLIRDIEVLKQICNELNHHDINTLPPPSPEIMEFSFEYLIDCVRILIFFENYMKAELIAKEFCIHVINKEHPKLKELAKQQLKRPIHLTEINELERFQLHEKENILTHEGIKETTLSMRILTDSNAYLQEYQLTADLIAYIKSINRYRNQLHFHNTIEFTLSEDFIDKIQEQIDFVNNIIRNRIRNVPH